ncbi:MAG: TldD/PmbA family protein [Bryobacterales bacterium]|nr:TldD/PmbA family protein [Bryobacterales bacterium]
MTPVMTLERSQELFDQVLRSARALGVPDVEATVMAGSHALTRFANNGIHQNVSETSSQLSVRAWIDGRTGRASTNRMTAGAIREAVAQSVAITRAQERDPEMLPLAGPAPGAPVERYFGGTADASPQSRAEAVAEAIQIVEEAGQTAAGIYSTGESILAILNSAGVRAYHAETMCQFSITAMAADSSGWAKASACDRGQLDPAALAGRAARKAAGSREPAEASPGRYTVILEPAAVLDLVGQMFADFSGTALADGRSFLASRMNSALFGTNISIVDDAGHPLQSGAPFDGEGLPRVPLSLVRAGVPEQVAWSRQAAHGAGVDPTGHGFPLPNEYGEAPMNIVMAGGETSLDRMIESTERGLLVTRLWYIREVDPYQKMMTGMTRDGTFLVEEGRVTRGVRNLRFNQSLIELLRNVEALSPSVRACGEEAFDMAVPAMKVNDFRFTEVTRF